MDFPEHMTFGAKYGPAMEIQSEADATAYLERCVQHNMRYSGRSREAAVEAEKANIGYWTGYYGRETAERVMRLFDCAHPLFGRTQPTAGEALVIGMAAARKAARKAGP